MLKGMKERFLVLTQPDKETDGLWVESGPHSFEAAQVAAADYFEYHNHQVYIAEVRYSLKTKNVDFVDLRTPRKDETTT